MLSGVPILNKYIGAVKHQIAVLVKIVNDTFEKDETP